MKINTNYIEKDPYTNNCSSFIIVPHVKASLYEYLRCNSSGKTRKIRTKIETPVV